VEGILHRRKKSAALSVSALPWAFAFKYPLFQERPLASTRATCAGLHVSEPRGVGMPCAVRPAAMVCRLAQPLSCNILMAGKMSAARLAALARRVVADACLQRAVGSVLRAPPSFSPSALHSSLRRLVGSRAIASSGSIRAIPSLSRRPGP
jgi:hypothetical protein